MKFVQGMNVTIVNYGRRTRRIPATVLKVNQQHVTVAAKSKCSLIRRFPSNGKHHVFGLIESEILPS